ncbi:hypothetical protein KPH14_004981 [Odynerus spinipes]|uniref:Uncharacterized protein n=1 Tax=Odynerus spinipes TaxID=1348599 RepID=A0AAD9RP25_9HYME|nr:hypothetical protein KPH14_004981 [Odynerus spinipes]
MTSRLRSSPSIPKEKSKATSFDGDTFYYEPEETTGKSYGRARRDNTYRFGDFKRECPESNGRRYGEETEEDPDLLYKRSKDRFGSWEIKDIAGDSPRRLRDGKLLERGITETSKKIPDSREEERNGSRRTTGEVTEKTEKEGILNSSRNGTFFGESLKIRRNGESQRKPSFVSSSVDGITAPSSEDRRIVVGTTIDRARTREEDEDEDDPRRHRHRHRRRHRYLFDGSYGDDHRANDSTREEASSGVDRRKPKSTEKTSRGYELFLANKDSTSFRIEEQRIPRCTTGAVGAASDEANDADREDDRDVDREEEPDIELEDNDRRGARENSLRKSDRYVVETAHKRSISKDGGEGEATRSKDNARRTVRPFGYTSLPTEEFDIRIQKYERALVEPRRDLDLSKKNVSREVDRAPSKRDSSKDRDREVVRRISFRDVDVPRKSSIKDTDPATTTTTTTTTATTTTTTRRTSFKDQDNGIRARNSFKNDHEGGIKCTIKSRSNDITKSNHFEGESTDLGRRSSFKGQRPEIGKISFETREGEVVGKRSSLKDGYGHGHGTDRIFLNDEKIESERRRTYRHESPSSLERIPRDNQKRQVVTDNEKNAKSGESAETTTAGRRVSKERGNVLGRRISFKDRDIDKSERKNSYGVYRDVDKDSNDEGTRRKSGCSFDDRFESFESDRNVLTSRDRVSQASGRNRSKEVVDVSRGETDSRAYPSKEYVRSPEKKSVRHSRALTPPRGRGRSGGGGGGGGVDKDPIRSTESWREDNRLFATRYLRENGRAMDRKGSLEGGYDYDDEGDDGESEPEHEVVRSIAVNVPQDRADNRIDPDTRGRVASTIERNGTTIVRILSGAGGAQNSRGDLERRRRRRGVQQELCLENRRRRFDASRYDSDEEAARGDEVWEELEEDDDLEKEQGEEDEEDYDDDKEYRPDPRRGSRRDNGLIPGIAGPTPSRRLWNYREGVWHFSESIAFDRTVMVQKREAIFINRWRR